ncbi:hypothetical protein [Polyangium aurulentum]|uniref:hypothetical protein n=1 Tax=Polyangium aurulentum TaxID=2567896 RepID=UPI001F2EDE72|nr:hypothetical protein [Polyangium aurulentum]
MSAIAPGAAGVDAAPQAPAPAPAAPAAPVRARSPYIAGRAYDWAFFLLPPLASFAFVALLRGTAFMKDSFWLNGERTTWAALSLNALVHAHLVAVAARSHLNPDVFERHRVRFVIVPVVLFAAMMVSMWAVVIATVTVVFWDVYHSALQTFGLGRIYDRNAGNDPAAGRKLDLGLNLLLYAGPIVAGATMLTHFGKLEHFAEVDALFFTEIPVFMLTNQRYLAWTVIAGGAAFLVYYVLAYIRLARRGYKVSFQKVFLLATTGLCSVWAWGFNPWGQALFIMNLFHAVQYLALVWWSEGRSLQKRMRLDRARLGKPIALAVFLVAIGAYGAFAEVVADEERAFWSLTQVVALMHFFYDGFIWSVRKRQV